MALRPMLASSASALPVGGPWSYEVKWDGYRIIAEKVGARVVLWTRNQNNVTTQYPTIAWSVSSRRNPSRSTARSSRSMSTANQRPLGERRQHLVTPVLFSPVLLSEPLAKHGRWGEGITAEDMAEMQWVKPLIVVEVSFVEWTAAGVLTSGVRCGA